MSHHFEKKKAMQFLYRLISFRKKIIQRFFRLAKLIEILYKYSSTQKAMRISETLRKKLGKSPDIELVENISNFTSFIFLTISLKQGHESLFYQYDKNISIQDMLSN